jgi:hypothetical protein
MIVELVVRYLGYGERCSGCGHTKETTRFTIRKGELLLSQYLLCDSCQDHGYVVKFTIPDERPDGKFERKRRVKLSRKLEMGVARDIGGYTTAGSGNQDEKADIRKIDEWRIEHKYTSSVMGYRLETKQLDAVIKHANMTGERPALLVDFRRLARKFVVIPYETFLEIVEKLRESASKHRRPR